MARSIHPRTAPALEELAKVIERSLKGNFASASASVVPCPDLRQAPFGLAAEGLSGSPRVADVGGQGNLFPSPNFDARFGLLSLASLMDMQPERGFVLGAGAAPFQDIGHNAELAPNLSWTGKDDATADFNDLRSLNITNGSRIIEIDGISDAGAAGDEDEEQDDESALITCRPAPSTNCALMVNLFGCSGHAGPVLKITAKSRTGPANFTNAIRAVLLAAYGSDTPISMGGVFLLKRGRAKFHVMPDFPAEKDLPFRDRVQLEEDWLVYRTFEAPVVCLSVLHSADPEELGLRMEHTHYFDPEGNGKGGHYHYDLDIGEEGEEVEYEGYFNVAEVVYRVDPPGNMRHVSPA